MIAKRVVRSALIALSMLFCTSAAMAQAHAKFDPDTGLFRVEYKTSTVVDAEFSFWRGEWSWLGLGLVTSVVEPLRRYSVRGDAAEKMTLDADVELSEPGKATWALRLKEDPERATDVFGTIIFRISSDALKRKGFDPVADVRPDRMGWSLLLEPDKPPLTITFDKPVESLSFEMGNRNEIRAYLLQKNTRPDSLDLKMTVSLPGEFVPTLSERLGEKKDTWWASDIHWNRTPVDLSFLNAEEKPAGKRGFLHAVGEDLVFEDGTKARFWGTNLSGYALFQGTTPELVRNQAKRISKLGFNLVRIHHHDSAWVSPNIFGAEPPNTLSLNAASLEKIDWWIKCLRDEGIYVWLDLHVGRKLKKADGVDAFQEIADKDGATAEMKGYMYVNDSIKARTKEFADAYLSHVNPHTGLAYKDDPAVVTVLITNENDLTQHYGNGLLPDKNVPWHSERYLARADAFAAKSGLDKSKVWRSWEFGASKIFLADLEHAYFSDMTSHLRKLGVKVPIVGTNYWGGMNTSGLTSLAEGDMVDAHAYGGTNEVEHNPRFTPSLMSWISGGAIVNKPFSVSEWNVEPFPVFDRFQVPAHLASVASLQGWNALLQYAYTQAPMNGYASVGNWEGYNDPALLATMPAAALLFRAKHVSEAKSTYELDLPEKVFTGTEVNARTSRAIRTLTETSKLRIRVPQMPALSWITEQPAASSAKQITDPDFDAIGEGKTSVCSDTGELCRDWQQGVFTVNTAKSQIASGWLGGKTIALRDVTVALSTANAAVAVQSLDGEPLPQSSRLMVSISARSTPEVQGRLPYLTEPVEGEVRIRARAGLNAYKADREGVLSPVPLETTAEGYTLLRLTPDIRSHWLFLQ